MWECIPALPFPRNSDRVLIAWIAPQAPRRFCSNTRKAVADHVRSNHNAEGRKKEEEKGKIICGSMRYYIPLFSKNFRCRNHILGHLIR